MKKKCEKNKGFLKWLRIKVKCVVNEAKKGNWINSKIYYLFNFR